MKKINPFQACLNYLLCIAMLFQSCGVRPNGEQQAELINKSRLEGEITQKRYLSFSVICSEESNPENKQVVFINLAHAVNQKKESELKINAFIVLDIRKGLKQTDVNDLSNLFQEPLNGIELKSDADFFNAITSQRSKMEKENLFITDLNIDQIKDIANNEIVDVSVLKKSQSNIQKFGFGDYFSFSGDKYIAQIDQTRNNPIRVRVEYAPYRLGTGVLEFATAVKVLRSLTVSGSTRLTVSQGFANAFGRLGSVAGRSTLLGSLGAILGAGYGAYTITSGLVSIVTGETYDTYWEELWNYLLVDEDTSPGVVVFSPNGLRMPQTASASWGDPHLKTFDNLSYNFQAVGEYVYLKSTTSNFEVQVRQEDLYNTCWVSFNTAVAINTGKEKISIYANPPRVLLDGKSVSESFTELKLKGNGKILKEQNVYLLSTSEQDSLKIVIWDKNLDIYVAPDKSRKGKLSGIAGNFDGDPGNDLMIDNNRIFNADYFPERYTLFANYYKVKQENSLFTYENGKNTASYFKQCPSKEVNINDLPNRKWAEDICRKAGVTSEPTLTNCILDVALSNDASFARGAAVAANTLSSKRVITTLNFPLFEQLNDFITTGSASLKDNCLQITEEKGDQTAAVFTKNKAKINQGFEVSFSFSISNPGGLRDPDGNQGGDGFAFVVHNESNYVTGQAGFGMGYAGIPKSIAIEIDTWRNEYDPHPLSDHISLNTQGVNPNSANDNQSLVKAVTKPLGNVSDGQIHKLVIKSIPAGNGESEIVAYLDEGASPVLSAKLNFINLLGKDADGKAFIGFTGSTGGAWQIAKIHNLKFRSGLH